MKAILITGGAGFIGSNFIPYFLEQHENYHVINLDTLTYAGDFSNLKTLEKNSRYTFIKGDILEFKNARKKFSLYIYKGRYL